MFNKNRMILLFLIVITSIITTMVSTNIINHNKEDIIKSKSKKLNTVASEYTSLNNRITTLNTTYSNVGLYYSANPSAVTLSTKTEAIIASVTLPAGSYLLIGSGRFNKNATGDRRVRIGTGDITSSDYIGEASPATSASMYTYVTITRIVNLTSSKTYNLTGWQSSGSSINVTGRIQAVRFK